MAIPKFYSVTDIVSIPTGERDVNGVYFLRTPQGYQLYRVADTSGKEFIPLDISLDTVLGVSGKTNKFPEFTEINKPMAVKNSGGSLTGVIIDNPVMHYQNNYTGQLIIKHPPSAGGAYFDIKLTVKNRQAGNSRMTEELRLIFLTGANSIPTSNYNDAYVCGSVYSYQPGGSPPPPIVYNSSLTETGAVRIGNDADGNICIILGRPDFFFGTTNIIVERIHIVNYLGDPTPWYTGWTVEADNNDLTGTYTNLYEVPAQKSGYQTLQTLTEAGNTTKEAIIQLNSPHAALSTNFVGSSLANTSVLNNPISFGSSGIVSGILYVTHPQLLNMEMRPMHLLLRVLPTNARMATIEVSTYGTAAPRVSVYNPDNIAGIDTVRLLRHPSTGQCYIAIGTPSTSWTNPRLMAEWISGPIHTNNTTYVTGWEAGLLTDITGWTVASQSVNFILDSANVGDYAATAAQLDGKVDKVSGKVLSDNNYSTTEKNKLAGIATGATANQTDAHLLNRANHTGSQAMSTVTGLVTSLDGKVDKVSGMGLSAENYTTADKNKLAGIATGATANDTDANLRNRANHTGSQAMTTITGLPAALDNKVDKVTGKGLSQEDFTTANKNKLDGIAAGATANQTDAHLLNRANHTGTQAIGTITGLSTSLDSKVDKVTGKGLSQEDYTTAEKNKLAGIEAGAQQNVQPDWDATSGPAAILNKPTIPSQQGLEDVLNVDPQAANSSMLIGGVATSIRATAGNDQLHPNDYTLLVDANGGNVTIDLPNSGIFPGQIYVIKRTDNSGFSLSLSPMSGTIDGSGTLLMAGGSSLTVQWDGTDYHIIGSS